MPVIGKREVAQPPDHPAVPDTRSSLGEERLDMLSRRVREIVVLPRCDKRTDVVPFPLGEFDDIAVRILVEDLESFRLMLYTLRNISKAPLTAVQDIRKVAEKAGAIVIGSRELSTLLKRRGHRRVRPPLAYQLLVIALESSGEISRRFGGAH